MSKDFSGEHRHAAVVLTRKGKPLGMLLSDASPGYCKAFARSFNKQIKKGPAKKDRAVSIPIL